MHWNRSLWNKLQDSLLLRLGGMVVAITLLAMVGMSTSWMVAETTQGNGESINVAGSLRMQSWRMASLYQRILQSDQTRDKTIYRDRLQQAIGQFEQKLAADSIHATLSADAAVPLNQAYRQVESRWQQHIKPDLQQMLADNPSSRASDALLDKIPVFVDQVDDLVKHIEEATEAKIFVLRVILSVTILGTLLIVALSVYVIHNILVQPLQDLLLLTDQIRQGHLAARSGLAGEDEIGQLGQAFNRMAEELSKLYQDLEARVEQKTAELTRSNRSLDLLYRSITRLHGVSPDQQVFHQVLNDAEAVLGLGIGTVCLKGDHDQQGRVVATTAQKISHLCDLSTSCAECHDPCATRMDALPNGHRILRLPLADAEHHYGILAVDVPPGVTTETWQWQLLEALSRHIGVTLASEQRSEQHRRVSLLEERAVIARELHDSLAQSLAYMKIQLSRLRHALKDPAAAAETADAIEELHEGLHSSYQELRELLSTFRLRMEDASLGIALQQTTAEFAERGKLPIQLEADPGSLNLTPNEEIHLLQIVREALSNILNHAQAQHAWVTLEPQQENGNTDGNTENKDNKVQLRIEDDGIGIREAAITHHYGMVIMDERARALHGMIRYLPRVGGGTCVQLNFTPTHTHPATTGSRTAHAA